MTGEKTCEARSPMRTGKAAPASADTWPAWRPIASAPKDGATPILTWDGSCYAVVVWCGCRQEWLLVERENNRANCESPTDWLGITHWMPLPPGAPDLLRRPQGAPPGGPL